MRIVEPHLVRAKGCVHEAELKFDCSQVSIEADIRPSSSLSLRIRPSHLYNSDCFFHQFLGFSIQRLPHRQWRTEVNSWLKQRPVR